MGQLTKINPQLPAIFQQADEGVFDEYSEGVVAGFPVISYKGKVWSIKQGGETKQNLDDEGDPIPYIEVVLVKANPALGKIFYEKQYEEGDNEAPRCWSADGLKPDSGVIDPIHANCAGCPKNVWGSRITDQGNKTKACSDHRRMAVTFRAEVEKAAQDPSYDPTMFLLRSPPATLAVLRDYVEKVLQPKGVPPYALYTKISFDTKAAFPKLVFKGVQFLNDDEARVVMQLRESEDTKRILAESEHGSAGTTGSGEGPGAAASAAAEPAPAPAELNAAQAEELQSIVDEEDDDIAPPAPVGDDDDDEIAAPAPKPKAAKPKAEKPKAAKPKAAKPKAPVPAEESDDDDEASDGEQSFDDMLDSILAD